jgi:hypothetical protein
MSTEKALSSAAMDAVTVLRCSAVIFVDFPCVYYRAT